MKRSRSRMGQSDSSVSTEASILSSPSEEVEEDLCSVERGADETKEKRRKVSDAFSRSGGGLLGESDKGRLSDSYSSLTATPRNSSVVVRSSASESPPLPSLPLRDVVTLNVGGRLFTTKFETLFRNGPIFSRRQLADACIRKSDTSSTLTLDSGSGNALRTAALRAGSGRALGSVLTVDDAKDTNYFRALLSGRFAIERDANGHVFIDRSAALFEVIIAFLRSGYSELPRHHVTYAQMRVELDFYSLLAVEIAPKVPNPKRPIFRVGVTEVNVGNRVKPIRAVTELFALRVLVHNYSEKCLQSCRTPEVKLYSHRDFMVYMTEFFNYEFHRIDNDWFLAEPCERRSDNVFFLKWKSSALWK